MSKRIGFALLVTIVQSLVLVFPGWATTASSLTVSTSSVNFGTVSVGSGAQQQIRFTSAAFGATITAVSVSGTYFTASGFTPPLALTRGSSAVLTVTFSPRSAGAQTGKIVVTGRGFSTAVDITLSGNGIANAKTISVVPSSGSFGNVPLGSTNSQTFTLTNHGNAAISVSSEAVSGAGFSMSGLASGSKIEAGKSSTFNVAFEPTKIGATSGSASIDFSASGATTRLTVSASGNGIAAIVALKVSLSSMSFGNVAVGKSSSLALKLTNAGNSKLSLTRPAITGAGFRLTGGLSGLTLEPGQSDSVEIVFEPTAKGSVSGKISILAGSTTTSVALSGTGTAAEPSSPSHTVLITWIASSSPSVAGYYVERGTISGGPYEILNSSKDTETSYVDSTIQNGKEYFYVVVAVNNGGHESKPSEQVSVTIPSP